MDSEAKLQAIARSAFQELVSWCENPDSPFLAPVFDFIKITGYSHDSKSKLSPFSTFGQSVLTSESEYLQSDKQKFSAQLSNLKLEFSNSRHSTALFYYLEKYASSIPSNDEPDTSIYDYYKTQAIEQVLLFNKETHHHTKIFLLCVDIKGIQKFIYNIASQGALRNLRSRSFYVELLAHHVTTLLIRTFNLTPVNIIMNGGGTIYLLASGDADFEEKLTELEYKVNQELSLDTSEQLYTTITGSELQSINSAELGKAFYEISRLNFTKKRQKHKMSIDNLEFQWMASPDVSPRPCQICGNDLKIDQASENCTFCDSLIKIGNKLPGIRYIYSVDKLQEDCLSIGNSIYKLSSQPIDHLQLSWLIYQSEWDDKEFVKYISSAIYPIFTASHVTQIKDLPSFIKDPISDQLNALKETLSSTIDADEKHALQEQIHSLQQDSLAQLEHLAQASQGAHYIAALSMDVDNMGIILQKNSTLLLLSNLIRLSRTINSFFKFTISQICQNKNVHVIYAGGDDLFTIGAWYDIVQLSFVIGEYFKSLTCNHPDMGISGAFTLHKPKVPMASITVSVKQASQRAKQNNLKPCWMCTDEWMKCPLLKNGHCLRKFSLAPFYSENNFFLNQKLADEERRRYSFNQNRMKYLLRFHDVENAENEVFTYLQEPFRILKESSSLNISHQFFNRMYYLSYQWIYEGMMSLPHLAWALGKMRKKLISNKDSTGTNYYEWYQNILLEFNSIKLSSLHLPLTYLLLYLRGGEINEL